MRIDVLEVGKAGLVLGLAMHGDAVHGLGQGGGRGERESDAQGQAGEKRGAHSEASRLGGEGL